MALAAAAIEVEAIEAVVTADVVVLAPEEETVAADVVVVAEEDVVRRLMKRSGSQ